ncbi:hypothetical protein V5799_018303 [Amblyomma americanum]|uniref:RING-type domain-containing protein n=1 Tax=Amblyomma americanum TaxID=6943 RepID=A0AAQ4F058_AMBAM
MSRPPEAKTQQRGRSSSVNSDARRTSKSVPGTEEPAFQAFRASANKVLASRIQERLGTPQRPEPVRQPTIAPHERQVASITLRCNCCTRVIFDGWKAVHCEHVICIDCMVRTSRELIHCQLCLSMCDEDGDHGACIVCFGCELLCRCPERLERVALHSELRHRTTGRKPLEFYKRFSRRRTTWLENVNLTANFGDVFQREGAAKAVTEPEGKPDQEVHEKLQKLSAKQHKMEERLKYLESNFERLQGKVEDLARARPPEALFQQFQDQQQQYGGGYHGQFQGFQQAQPIFQPPDPWQVQGMPQPYADFDPLAQAFGQPPAGYQEPYQNEFPQVSLFDAMRQAAGQQNLYGGTEAPPRRAFVAVLHMGSPRGSPDDGMFGSIRTRGGGRSMESSIVIKEIYNDTDDGRERKETKDCAKGQSEPVRYYEPTENTSRRVIASSIDVRPVRNRSSGAVKPQKRDAETSVQMGNLVTELTRLYDKVTALEVDNERLREEQRNLKKENARMRGAMKELRYEQARSRQNLLGQVQQQPLIMQTQVQQPQQTMSMHCAPGGQSTTAIKLGVDAFADHSSNSSDSSNDDDESPSNGRTDDSSKSSGNSGAKKSARVDEEVNIVVHSAPAGEIMLNNDATPGKTLAFTRIPTIGYAPTGIYGAPQNRRTASLPSQSVAAKGSDSDLETYKERVNDIMDWYKLCKRKEAFLEQTTLAYLRHKLGNGCHYLDYGRDFRWELDRCLKLSSGKSCFRDFRVFSGPIVDVASRGLIRFVIDPLPSSICLYVEILISAKPKRGQGYTLRVHDVKSRKDFHCKRYTSEDMFGFRGVFSYPGTPCLGFFSVMVRLDHSELPRTFRTGDTLLIELAKT